MLPDHARRRRALLPVSLLFCLAALAVVSCRPSPDDRASGRTGGVPGGELEPEVVPELFYSLSEGETPDPDVDTTPPAAVDAQPLDAARVAALLARLDAPPAIEDPTSPVFHDPALPPPRKADVVEVAFPADATDDTAGGDAPQGDAAAPLTVTRHAPEGVVPVAPRVSLTFSQPMVGVGQHQADAASVPASITPQVPGQWRWVGTRTLVFEPDGGRLPMATRYEVVVPAGVTAASGAKTADELRFEIETPRLAVQNWQPANYYALASQPVLAVRFNQRVDADALVPHLTLTADGKPVGFELVDRKAVQDDRFAAWLLQDAPDGFWLALRPTEPLPRSASVVLELGQDAPSTEGPLLTTAPFPMTWTVHGDFELTDFRCGWEERGCTPQDNFEIRFSNPIDLESFDKSLVTVDPPTPHLQVYPFEDGFSLYGPWEGRTTYTVTIASELRDAFGQTLGEPGVVTFDVGDPMPSLTGPAWDIVVLDPSTGVDSSVFTVSSTGIRKLAVRVLEVEPTAANVQTFQEFRNTFLWGGVGNDAAALPTPPGREVFTREIEVPDGGSGKQVETHIDLAEVFGADDDPYGHAIVIVEPVDELDPDVVWYKPAAVHWVERTDTAITTLADPEGTLVWVANAADGETLTDVEVSLVGASGEVASARTGADGMARLPLADSGTSHVLLARRDGDVAMLPWYGGSKRPERQLRWYVVDDRHMYRPGEQVHLKGWLRHDNLLSTDLGRLAANTPDVVTWQVTDSYGNPIGEGKTTLGGLDSFELEFEIPEQVNLGWAYVTLTSGEYTDHEGYQYSHGFEIQAFRRPEFEVTSELLDPGPHFPEGAVDVLLQASYYAGGALPDATVNWSVYASPGSYAPPGHERFSFGPWSPWWYGGWGHGYGGGGEWKTLVGRTDSRGRHTLHVDLEGMSTPRPMVLTANGSVSDANYQAWSTTETVLVHPASVYVGLRTEKSFFEPDESVAIETIVSDLDGALVGSVPVRIEATLLTWQRTDDQGWQLLPDGEPPEVCEVGSIASGPASCEVVLDAGGTWRLLAHASDASGRPTRTELRVWVAGGDLPPQRGLQAQEVTLVPETREVSPGDTARVLVQAPFVPAEALVTVARRGVISHERLHLTEPTTTLELPVDERWIGGVQIQVSVLGESPRTGADGLPDDELPRAPAYGLGTLPLEVSVESRRLTVEPTPRDAVVAPGAKTTVDVAVTDHQGNPVPDTEVLLIVVDESVLALSDHELPDPIEVFYTQVYPWFSQVFLHQYIVLDDPARLSAALDGNNTLGAVDRLSRAESTTVSADAAMPLGGAVARGRGDRSGKMEAQFAANTRMPMEQGISDFDTSVVDEEDGRGGEGLPTARVRRNFDALALFAPDVVTDASGRAAVEVDMPDSLTRYRIIAVAADPSGKRFGKGDANLQARHEMMVRPSAPRFLHVGDAARVPVLLQNASDAPMTVDVAARHHGSAAALDASVGGWRVQVPANDRVEVFFPLEGLAAGGAHLEFIAATGDDRLVDASEVILPIAAPSTIESHATYGELDDDKAAVVQPIALPAVPVVDGVGSLTVTTSSTALAALTDAMIYLVHYPFECSEQLASRLLSVASLRDVLAALEAEELPEPEALREFVERDLALLEGRQNWDGGWGWWRQGQESSPWLTVHVVHAIVRARDAGYTLQSPWVMDNALNYLRNIESYIPSWIGPRARRAIIAYALYTRALSGESVELEVVELIDEAGTVDEETMSLETVAWLMAVLPASHDRHAVLREHLSTHVSEEAGTAMFIDDYSETGAGYILLHSNRRTDAVVLDALMRTEPKSDLVAKVVRGLLAHRKRGRWSTTQENAWVLVALGEYFDRVEAQTPDFVARVWLGPDVAGAREFKGRSTTEEAIEVPLDWLRAHPDTHDDVAIRKDGDAGRLYYRIGMRWAPRAENLQPLERGFAVSRTYEALDDPADVSQDASGVWHVAAGARVRVRLTMVVPERRHHVALVDKLPAGFEAQNPELAVTGAIPPDPNTQVDAGSGWLWWGTWYEHQNLRDQQAEAFSQLVWEGTYEYSYVARATTPGSFIAPPPRVEEMYHPETFGRGASERVVIE